MRKRHISLILALVLVLQLVLEAGHLGRKLSDHDIDAIIELLGLILGTEDHAPGVDGDFGLLTVAVLLKLDITGDVIGEILA